METIAVKNVKDLQESGKHWLEGVLGQHLQDNQQVFIMLFTPGVEPDEVARRTALQGLEETWKKVNQHVSEQGIADVDFEGAVDEAMDHVRRREP